MLATLILKTWRDHWRAILGWSLGLAALAGVELAVYPTIRNASVGMSKLMDSFPPALKTMFRITDYTSGPGFLSTELFSIMVPLVFICVGASWGSSATTTEEERGTGDLLLTLPISRTDVVMGKLIAIVTALAGLGVLLWVVLVLGSRAVNLHVGTLDLAWACAAVVLLGWVYAGIGLLIGALSGRHAIALGSSIALALAAFLLYSLGPLVHALQPWLKATPFHWALGNDPLRNGVPLQYAGLLVLVSVGLFAAAALAFQRRDIGT